MLLENKMYLYLDTDNISDLNLKKVGSGSESEIYLLNNNILLKVYKEELLEEMPEIYNDDRICEISRKKIKQTKLPIGPLYINGEFKGCFNNEIKYAPNLEKIKFIIGKENKINKFLELNEKLHELEENKLYYIGLKSTNILLPKLKDIALVGLDGNSVRLSEDKNGYYSYRMYSELLCLILEKIFNKPPIKDEDIIVDDIFDNYLVPYKIKEEFYNKNYSYELIRDFLNYIKEEISIKNNDITKKLTFVR
jgi:hypothetical protein